MSNRNGDVEERTAGTQAFTMLELLVLIAIVAILAAILVPAFVVA
ncbi:prepilin-type N-terminal cleavage/methylation domain-containing protein [bacterium]|nr:MAG: prepilin-type N-terminal cleavage/methylation domain-containing protein [bacterium]